jgi:Skp family chaperone for outer membrane proteins
MYLLINLVNSKKFKLEMNLMKKTILEVVAFFSVLILFSTNAFAQTKAATEITVGVVDVEAILKEMPEALEGEKVMIELQKKFQDSLLAKRQAFETKFQNYQKQKPMMAADKQQVEEETLNKEYQDLQTYATDKQTEIGAETEKILEPIREKIKQVAEVIAKEEKISLLLIKNPSYILYFDTKIDITFRVIDRIKRGEK